MFLKEGSPGLHLFHQKH